MSREKIREWSSTALAIENEVNNKQRDAGWRAPQARRLLNEQWALTKLLEVGKPVGILDDVSDTGMPPILVIIEINPRADRAPSGLRDELGFMLWDEPLIRVFDLNGDAVWEGTLMPSDHELILKFSINHYVMVLSGKAFDGTIVSK